MRSMQRKPTKLFPPAILWLAAFRVIAGAIFICTVFICTASAQNDEQESDGAKLFRWKFARGDQFEVDFVQELSQTTDVNGKKFSYVINFDLGMTWNVSEVTAEQATVKQSFRHLKVEWTPAGGEEPLLFDSRLDTRLRGPTKKIAETLLPLLDCEFDVVMTNRGELLSVEVGAETKTILRSLPDSMEIRKLFTKDGISKTLSQAAIVFPEDKIAIGSGWETTDEIQAPAGKVTHTRKYSYDGSEKAGDRRLEKLSVTGEIQFAQTTDSKARKPQTVGDNSQSGELMFDTATGNLVSSQLNQSISTTTPYRDTDLKAGTKTSLTINVKRLAGNESAE